MCASCRARATKLRAIATDIRILAQRGRQPGFADALLLKAAELDSVATQVLQSCTSEADVVWVEEPDALDAPRGESASP